MRIGYDRVSTLEQNLALQIDELKNARCEMIFTEKISGKSKDDCLELKFVPLGFKPLFQPVELYSSYHLVYS